MRQESWELTDDGRNFNPFAAISCKFDVNCDTASHSAQPGAWTVSPAFPEAPELA